MSKKEFDNISFIVHPDCKRRNSAEDRRYRDSHSLTIMATYKNRCANCGNDENGIALDHFLVPFNAEGTYRILLSNGKYMNNAIPLCKSCNSSKGKKTAREFFAPDKFEQLLAKNNKLSKRLNNYKWRNKFPWQYAENRKRIYSISNGILLPKNVWQRFLTKGSLLRVNAINTGTEISFHPVAEDFHLLPEDYASVTIEIEGAQAQGNFKATKRKGSNKTKAGDSRINTGKLRSTVGKKYPRSTPNQIFEEKTPGILTLIS